MSVSLKGFDCNGVLCHIEARMIHTPSDTHVLFIHNRFLTLNNYQWIIIITSFVIGSTSAKLPHGSLTRRNGLDLL